MGLDQILKCKTRDNEEKEIYWRKCNFVQNFFEDKIGEVDNCVYYHIKKEWIYELIEKCENVLADNSLADSQLPTASGFFWGSTKYDEYYFDDVKYTLEKLNEVKSNICFVYWAWW